MSLIQFLRILAARRAIILATLIACFVTATITAELLPARYEAKNRVMIDMTKPDPVTGQLLASNALGNYIATQLKLITDEQTAAPVVDQLGWTNDPAIIASFERAGSPGGDLRAWLADQLVQNTQAKFLEASNIIEISYRGADPNNAQRIAEMLRDSFIQQNLTQRRATATRAANSYNEQADRVMQQIRAEEEQRAQFARANGIVLQADNTDLESSKLATLSTQSAMPAFPSMGAPASPAEMQLETVKQQLAQAATTLGPNHPTYQALERQKSVLEAEVARGGGGRVSGAAIKSTIQNAFEAQKARVLAQSDKVDHLNQMQQDINVLRDQYQKLAQKAQELRGEAQMNQTNLVPLGNTAMPDKPVWPNKPLIIFGSIALGAVLGVLLALLVELTTRRVRSDEDLEYAVDAPVFAIVGGHRNGNSWVAKLRRFLDRKGAAREQALAEG